MFLWLKPGGYASHIVDFTAHGLSPFWNGHWAYSSFQWRLVRGRREFLLNREPLSRHLAGASKAGFELMSLVRSTMIADFAQEISLPYFESSMPMMLEHVEQCSFYASRTD